MRMQSLPSRRRLSYRRAAIALLATLVILPASWSAARADGDGPGLTSMRTQTLSFSGLQIVVPAHWAVVDLRQQPDACVRYDRAAVFLGHTGDQHGCPAHLVGGAPVLQLERLGLRATRAAASPPIAVAPGGDLGDVPLSGSGPVTVAVEGAGVLLTAVYAPDRTELMRQVFAAARVLPAAVATQNPSPPMGDDVPSSRLTVPGTLHGRGFDTCGAPPQAAMDAWFSQTTYRSIGIYIGGVSRGCAQPNLTADWTARQAARGWHLVPTYVGRQAPCTTFHYRVSYDPSIAFQQGSAEAEDAAAEAAALGIVAPSVLYNDMEAYDNSLPRCVAGVLSYLSGWTHTLHVLGYQSGVYSSASSGIHDLSTHYDSPDYRRPDDIWIAWWNGQADIDGGSYVADAQWSAHRRDHQYVGNVSESHGGYTLQIDRDFLDVSAAVPPPRGCPANLDFSSYPMLSPEMSGDEVRAAQCLLASAGFDPGVATGVYHWRMGSALRAFKASVDLNPDDPHIRRWAWTALITAGPTQFLHLGVSGPRVSKVQRALTARLQHEVPITGYFGPLTREAVLAYQTLLQMRVTGTVGVPTWRAVQTGH